MQSKLAPSLQGRTVSQGQSALSLASPQCLPTTKVNFDPAPLHVRKHAVRNLSALAVNLIRDSSKLTAFCSCCCTPMVVKSQGSLIKGALRMFLLHMLVLAPLELYLKADRDLIFFFAQSFI